MLWDAQTLAPVAPHTRAASFWPASASSLRGPPTAWLVLQPSPPAADRAARVPMQAAQRKRRCAARGGSPPGRLLPSAPLMLTLSLGAAGPECPARRGCPSSPTDTGRSSSAHPRYRSRSAQLVEGVAHLVPLGLWRGPRHRPSGPRLRQRPLALAGRCHCRVRNAAAAYATAAAAAYATAAAAAGRPLGHRSAAGSGRCSWCGGPFWNCVQPDASSAARLVLEQGHVGAHRLRQAYHVTIHRPRRRRGSLIQTQPPWCAYSNS